jgi:hypothetical protein
VEEIVMKKLKTWPICSQLPTYV